MESILFDLVLKFTSIFWVDMGFGGLGFGDLGFVDLGFGVWALGIWVCLK